MDLLQITIWAATALGMVAVALAFFKSQRLAVRLGVLAAFGVFYVAMVLWAPTDQIWADITLVTVLLIAFGSGMKKPSSADKDQGDSTHD